MRLLWILLPILAQGAFGALFKIQPPGERVVHRGDEVTLECVTNEDVTCAWKIEGAPQLGLSGLLLNSIPETVDITARDKTSKRDCTIIINNIDDRYNGNYKCSPYTSTGQEDSIGADVIIAKKPNSLRYLGNAADGFPLAASSSEPTTVQCVAEMARPKAEIVWYLGNTQLYDTAEVEDTQENDTGLWNSVSTLTYQFRKEDNGKSLRCRASHAGYDENDEDEREKAVDVDVRFAAYRPGDSEIGRLYGFTAGQTGEVIVNFTSNPLPSVMAWRVGDSMKVPVGGQSLDERFTAGSIIIKNASLDMYALKLTIDPVRMEDQSKTFVLQLENDVGLTEMEFMIGTGAAPPPEAISGATIGAIVAGVIVLLIIIGAVAFVVIRKRSFAAKTTEPRSDRSDTESAHDEKTDKPEKKPVKISALFSSLLKGNKTDADVEMAENKDETRELTKPDGEADGEAPPPPKKEGEVVYAELMLNSDGVKTEVRPSADKTEYAVIVGTKPEAADDAEDNKTKE